MTRPDTSKLDLKALKDLRRRGSLRVKPYGDPLPADLVITYREFVVSYVIEETFIGPQPTLAVSRKDRSDFKEAAIPKEISYVFPRKLPIATKAVFPNRGMTYMFYVKDGET